MKHSILSATILIAAGVILSLPEAAFATSWKEVSELSQTAITKARAGQLDDAARTVIEATRMRQALPKNLPSSDRSNTDGFASSQLESAFVEVANVYAQKSRWADLITFCKWHIGDAGHLNTVGVVTAWTQMGEAYRALNGLPEAEKCYKTAMAAYDSGRSSMSAAEIDQCKKMFPGYARVLKLQNKTAEAQSVTAKFAR